METWNLTRNDSDEAFLTMRSLINKIIIAPIIDKEFLIVSGWGYDKQLTDGLFTVTHIDTLPDAQGNYENRNVALRKYADASVNNTNLKLFIGLWQTEKINHYSLVQAWT